VDAALDTGHRKFRSNFDALSTDERQRTCRGCRDTDINFLQHHAGTFGRPIFGFLLMVSLAVSAALAAFGGQLGSILPFGKMFLAGTNFVVSLILISVLFAAIYKILPDRHLEWRDVAVGAVVTALLFTIGKSLIGWYIGSSAVASSYGAAGALIVLLLWVYYSAQIFLLGAEFTKAYANRHGGKRNQPVVKTGRPT
jgi:membrane protein